MSKLCGQTVYSFGKDQTTTTRYTFNSLGYRSDHEFELVDNATILLGNSHTFGLGVSIEHSFAGIINEKLQSPVYNFAWGSYAHENLEQLELLKTILSLITPKLIIFQINDLNRIRVNGIISFDNDTELLLQKFHNFFYELKKIVKTIPHILLHWDYEKIGKDLDFSSCLIHNKYHIDTIEFFSEGKIQKHIGRASHRLIATKILHKIQQLNISCVG